MSDGSFATFTDRREAIALFNFLRGRDPNKPWPLLPILTFIAPGGSGKSLLLRYLREKECSVSGRAALPFAYLDFTLSHAPKELLPILIELRDQLQKQADGEGRYLVFPRFDLGAMIAQSASSNKDIASFSPIQVRNELGTGVQLIKSIGALGSSLGNTIPYVAPFLAGLQLASQIKPVRELLSYLEDSTGWKWYRMHGVKTGIGANATMKDVLLRLQILSMIGRPERDVLVNELLPAAFIADIFDALLETDPPRAWSKRANLIFFLDGFEALQNAPGSPATRLLQVLTTVQRLSGKTDPLLLVIGGREYITKSEEGATQTVPFERMRVQDEQEVQRRVKTWHTQWQQRIPTDKHFLRLKDLLLTVELTDFGQEDTRDYLLKFGEQKQTQVFADESALIQTIDQVTHGHPLYLALAAEAVLEAKARGRHLLPNDFELAEVSPVIGAEHEDERIRDYLLNLFLRQLSEAERKELIFCAVPRFLDFALLHVLLPARDDLERKQRWDHYQRFTFMRSTGYQRIVFHPLVRTLLLRQLPADSEPESDYYQIQARLKDYFYSLSEKQRTNLSQVNDAMQTKIEEAYHALALGDPDPAIVLGVFAQQSNLTIWDPLLDGVTQSSYELIPDDTEQQAYKSLNRAIQYHDVNDIVKAIILYIWLLTQEDRASLQNNLGAAYSMLPGGNREANLRRAIACYEAALQVYTREAFSVDWATTQNNLGAAYSMLPGGDREANLRRAIMYYKAALQVQTQEVFPVDWATTQNNLGIAYGDLPGGDREANLGQAIACYEAVLQVQTREAFPVDWATTQNNLGTAYSMLPRGDREANLRQAIMYYEAALQVRTQEAFPVDWATTQNNLGAAYRNLPGGDREANVRQAIMYYKAALQVYTQEAFPVDWATVQYNLGNAYGDLPGGDREANLGQAIACYEAALQVQTREAFPADWATTQNNLGIAYHTLPGGDREANLGQAIACYEATLQVRTREAFPIDWATIQNNLGAAYHTLPGGDREANLRRAIACYEAVLQVRTREAFPVDWAMIQNNLGIAYGDLPGEDREANLRRAIMYYEAALQVQTREAFPADWATTQNNLGEAYRNLPGEDREANVRQAIMYYEAALQVQTREAFPMDWAMIQNNLGIAYGDLPGEDREANLRRAIMYYEAALQVRTREAFPADWATTQNNLGTAYNDLPGDREANLRQAIACYEAALQVQTREAFPMDWALTQNNLGEASRDLSSGDREANLNRAIAYYEAALQIFQPVHAYYASVVTKNVEFVRNELQNLTSDEPE